MKNNKLKIENEPFTLAEYEIGDRHRKNLGRALRAGKSIVGFVLSCPDYSSNGEIYTFEGGLGSSVPMMTRQHLNGISSLLEYCRSIHADISLVVLVADIEATNDALVNTYAEGDSEKYKKHCTLSISAIEEKYNQSFKDDGIQFLVGGFLNFFDDRETDRFLSVREKYYSLVKQKFGKINSFEFRVVSQVATKLSNGYYQLEYRENAVPDMPVLIEREFITMAEYLTLGELVRLYSASVNSQPFVVVHGGNNAGLLNDVGKFDPQFSNVPSIPLIKRTKQVY